MLIRVDPVILNQNSGSISGIGSNVNSSGQSAYTIAQAAPNIDGQFGPQVQAIGHEALARAQGLFGAMNNLSGQLLSKAQAFAAADMAGVTGFANITAGAQIPATGPWLSGLPVDIINLILKLGGLFGGASFTGLLGALLLGNGVISTNGHPIISIEKSGKLNDLQSSLDIPFVSQWNGTNGGNNCGPASVAMVLNYYGKNVKLSDVVSKMRGLNNPSGFINFQTQEVDQLFGSDLKRVDLNRTDFESQLGKSPIIIFVDTNKWHSVPYANVTGTQGPHIVVATGFEKDDSGNLTAVFVNDPLAIKWDALPKQYVKDDGIGSNFRVPIGDFNASTAEKWIASAVVSNE